MKYTAYLRISFWLGLVVVYGEVYWEDGTVYTGPEISTGEVDGQCVAATLTGIFLSGQGLLVSSNHVHNCSAGLHYICEDTDLPREL